MTMRTCVVAAVLVVALTSVSCGVFNDDARGECQEIDAAWVGTDKASDGGSIVVAESDFSVYPVGDAPHRQEQASIGVVLENGSTDVATNIVLSYQIVDENGKPALHPDRDNHFIETVPFIAPKGQMGIGTRTYSWSNVGMKKVPRPTYDGFLVEVTIESIEWWPAESMGALFPEISGTITSIDLDAADGADQTPDFRFGKVTFDTSSHYCEPAAAQGLSVIFRDSAGSIIGGFMWVAPQMVYIDPGRTTPETNFRIADIPADADPERSQIWVIPERIAAPTANPS